MLGVAAEGQGEPAGPRGRRQPSEALKTEGKFFVNHHGTFLEGEVNSPMKKMYADLAHL